MKRLVLPTKRDQPLCQMSFLRRYIGWGFVARKFDLVVGRQNLGAYVLVSIMLAVLALTESLNIPLPIVPTGTSVGIGVLFGFAWSTAFEDDYPPRYRSLLKRYGMRTCDILLIFFIPSLPMMLICAIISSLLISSATLGWALGSACAFLVTSLFTYGAHRLISRRKQQMNKAVKHRFHINGALGERVRALWGMRLTNAHKSEIVSLMIIVSCFAMVMMIAIGDVVMSSYCAGVMVAVFLPVEFLRGEGGKRAYCVRERYRISHNELADCCALQAACCVTPIIMLLLVFAIHMGANWQDVFSVFLLLPYFAVLSHGACRMYLTRGFAGRPGVGMQLVVILCSVLPLMSVLLLDHGVRLFESEEGNTYYGYA